MTYLTKEQQELIKNVSKLLVGDTFFNSTDVSKLLEIIRLQNLVIAKAVEQRNSMFFKARDWPHQCGDQLVSFSVYAERTDQQLTRIMKGKG